MRDGLVFVRHACNCVTVTARCLLDQFISVLPVCIRFSSPFLSSIHTHTHTTGLIFLQPAVNETVSLASMLLLPLYGSQSTYDMSITNSVQHTAVAIPQLGQFHTLTHLVL